MRKITAGQILVFFILLSFTIWLGIETTMLVFGSLPLGDFRGLVLVAAAIVFVYLYAIVIYRLFLHIAPLQEGEIDSGSQQEFIYHVYLLFYLILFYSLMRSGFIPVPLTRLMYRALGARLGSNTYSSGILFDPIFVEVGDNTLIGQHALIIPHAIEKNRLAHYRIRIGNNVTVGANAVVLAGVTIGDDALLATGAVVKKGTTIGAGEVWGGIPAQRLNVDEEKL